MENLVNRLREKRLEVAEAREKVVKIKEQLNKTELGLSFAQAIEYSSIANEEMQTIEKHLRQAALEHYKDTDDKNPVDGVSVIINRSLLYNIENAREWALKSAPGMLELNKKIFDKHAKATIDTVPLDFVTIENIPAVRIAKKL